jgi:hypothetical protein
MEKHFHAWNTCSRVCVVWKNLETNTWQGPDPLVTTGQGMLVSFQNMKPNQDGCLSDASNQSQLLTGLMKKLWLDKFNPSHWFNFGRKELMLLGLLSIIWLKRLITQETNHHKKQKNISKLFHKK